MNNDNIIKNIETSIAMEGYNLNRSDIDVLYDVLENKINVNDAIEKLKNDIIQKME